jgi:hypothetical protein
MVEIPQFDISKGSASDEMIRKRMVPLAGLSPRLKEAEFAFSGSLASDHHAAKGTRPGALAVDFLKDVQENPESGIAGRYKRLGLSVRQGQRLKAELAQKGLIEEFEERVPTGRIRRIRLTEQGEASISRTASSGEIP